MSDIRFLASYAVRSLLRGGQRSLLAVVCIAFGVLSLVAMQLLASVVATSTGVPPRLTLGGDMRVTGTAGGLSTDHVALLDSLHAAGTIERYTLFASGQTALLRSTRSGLVQFVGRALAVDPATWPLTGELRLNGGTSIAAALAQPAHVVITRDLALHLDVQAGDTLRFGGWMQRPASLVVGAVALAMPDRRGQTLLYSFETARMLADDPPLLVATATSTVDSAVAAVLSVRGMSATRAATQPPDRTARLFGTMLRGAGLLGLIIGGVGIAYTLQVLLARRRLEIATLRTMGYRTSRLLLLFGIEAALLGTTGGVLGAALAVALSAQLVHLLDRTAGALMLEYELAWGYVVAAPLLGVVVAVLFGMAAIVRAAAVRPAVLLRDLPIHAPRRAVIGAGALYGGIAFTFTLLAATVMGSVAAGAIVVVIALAGTLVLGGLLLGLLQLLVRLPLPALPLVRLARANLRSTKVRSAFSLIALFVGTFAIGFAATALVSGRDRVAERRGSDEGLNMRLFVGTGDEADARSVLRDLGAVDIVETRSLDVRVESARGDRLALPGQAEVMDEAALDALATVVGTSEFRFAAGQALLPVYLQRPPFSLATGDSIAIVTDAGRQQLQVAGFYEARAGDFFAAPRGLIVGRAAADGIGTAGARSLLAQFDPAVLHRVGPELGARLPASMVLSRRDMNDFIVSQYRSLFMFVVAVAGLALLAGAVLIANAASLAMLERRRELGVLMAVGYTSRRILRTILLENGGLGLVAGVTGVAAVHIVAGILNRRQPGIDLELGSGAAIALVVTAMVLAMGAAGAVAWKPVHVRPLEVLRDE